MDDIKKDAGQLAGLTGSAKPTPQTKSPRLIEGAGAQLQRGVFKFCRFVDPFD